ncbi:Cthe_2314 family HEPN domain-containing protein [Paenimyroides baculatum]|uniref:Cthe-2314-like HEPN domain-containing protein n=1 Tax=Paenimyroides baculatum TaxID=2608000 RepID=A0A5M6CQ50_9FLAO|nr:Cthe_2314 family HEPN domain-containing protein [Paenimyroides baculatum]KAA5535315.1 hypothetical protein F0460_08340 [Paenimyroides baculatum]
MKIEIKWENFVNPNLSDAKKFNSEYPALSKCFLEPIKKIHEIQLYDLDKMKYGLLKEQKYISEIIQCVGISKMYLTNLWFHSTQKPNRFKGGSRTANSISYETYYEIIYSKLSSSFDRFLHLVNIYYSLNINQRDITIRNIKNAICEQYKDESLSNSFYALVDNSYYQNISKIRNTFIHRELVFEKYHKINEDGVHYDSFQYKNNTESTILNFIGYIHFLNTVAIPFLYNFQKLV